MDWNWVFHTTPLTTQSWHLPSWSPINSLEMCISLTASSYKQFPTVDKLPWYAGSKFVNKFQVLIQGKFKSWILKAQAQFWGIIMGDYTQSIICQFMQVGKWQKLTETKLPATTDMIYTGIWPSRWALLAVGENVSPRVTTPSWAWLKQPTSWSWITYISVAPYTT